ncbi:UDP-2,4-diacetamido-2,4,6-trideoxy-beta-L-altropyranose hydrolase [bacterium]|nr:UDP-2,4-diacetamido-2,4,6-trideoxy-beta-L-altropyranose hydrolase [bacterium]
MPQEIWIRADSSQEIGAGHVGRCLALAQGLRQRGSQVRFICRDLPGALLPLIRESGFGVETIPAANAEEDARQVCALLEKAKAAGVIVDHYGLDARWEQATGSLVPWVFVIDDTLDRPHAADLLLNQNYLKAPERLPHYSKGAALWGPRYALLRPDFKKQRATARVAFNPERPRIGVFFGGADAPNVTGLALAALEGVAGAEVSVLVGASNPHKEFLAAQCRKLGFAWHSFTPDFAEYLASCDLAVGAGGSTVWERACLGIPSLVVSIAENQETYCRDMAEDGFHRYLGRHTEVSAGSLQGAIQEALTDWPQTIAMGTRSATLVDGDGVRRVCEALSALPIY